MIRIIKTVKEIFSSSANKDAYSVVQGMLHNTSEKSLAWNEFAIAERKKNLSSGKKITILCQRIDSYEWNRQALELKDKHDLEKNIE